MDHQRSRTVVFWSRLLKEHLPVSATQYPAAFSLRQLEKKNLEADDSKNDKSYNTPVGTSLTRYDRLA